MKIRGLIVFGIMLLMFGRAFADNGISSPDTDGLVFYKKGDPERGREKFVRFDCVKCHQVQADPDLPQPNLNNQAPLLGSFSKTSSPEELLDAILTPVHQTTAGYSASMPKDYKEKLSTQDLIDLVTYLRTVQE